jgi:hypothetical protein
VSLVLLLFYRAGALVQKGINFGVLTHLERIELCDLEQKGIIGSRSTSISL